MTPVSTEHAKEFLSFRLGGEEYGIDILAVREIRAHEKPTRIAGAPEFIRGVVNLRGVIVPIVDLRMKFGLDEAVYDALTVVIILNVGGRVLGIVVDAVSDVVKLKDEEVSAAPEFSSAVDASFLRGLASLEGRLLILLDIEALMASPEMALTDDRVAA